MAFKYFALFALVAVASAGVLPAYPTLVKQHAVLKQVEYDAPAQYEFAYDVHDQTTGDIKSQKESRNGDNVVGQYTLIDADGYRRVVEYTADEHNGFNAVVRREPIEGHKVIKAYAPVAKVVAAPVYKVASPVYAPVQKVVAAPVYASVQKVAAYDHSNAYNTVSFSGPSSNYHY